MLTEYIVYIVVMYGSYVAMYAKPRKRTLNVKSREETRFSPYLGSGLIGWLYGIYHWSRLLDADRFLLMHEQR